MPDREPGRPLADRLFGWGRRPTLLLAHVGGASMAEVFAKISSIEPLAIEQTMMIEHTRAEDDHPYYRAAIAATHPNAPFVFESDAGKPWSCARRRRRLAPPDATP